MDKTKIIAVIGVVLLLPVFYSVLNTIGSIFAIISTLQSISVAGQGDPKLLSGEISQIIVYQLLAVVVLIPGIIVATIAVLKCKTSAVWFRLILNIYAWLLTLCLPLLTVVGLYFHWLKRRAVV